MFQQSSDKQQSGCCHHHQNSRKLKSSQLETKGLNRKEMLLKSLTRHIKNRFVFFNLVEVKVF